VCALPYGINTPSVFVYIFLVMLPVKLAAVDAWMTPEAAAIEAWRAGLVACLGSGIIEALGSLVAERIRQSTPRAAQLSTLSGIALGFISMPFFFKAFAEPLVGITTLMVIMVVYFGNRRFRGKVPGGLVAVVLGTAICWITGVAPGQRPDAGVALQLPIPVIGDLVAAFGSNYLTTFFSVILPMASSTSWAPCRTSNPRRPRATASTRAAPWLSTG
jgi:AGZA family xanthine/uracil permease-like MFS transporter